VQNQTLPIISLVLGIFGLVFFCCYFGIFLGPAALITGYIGFQNVNKDPVQYGGKGLAIAGMVLGGISLVITLGFLILGIVSNIFK
jgi:hypothetical protein